MSKTFEYLKSTKEGTKTVLRMKKFSFLTPES